MHLGSGNGLQIINQQLEKYEKCYKDRVGREKDGETVSEGLCGKAFLMRQHLKYDSHDRRGCKEHSRQKQVQSQRPWGGDMMMLSKLKDTLHSQCLANMRCGMDMVKSRKAVALSLPERVELLHPGRG